MNVEENHVSLFEQQQNLSLPTKQNEVDVDHSTAVKLAAQAALETISYSYDELDQPQLVFPFQEYSEVSSSKTIIQNEEEEDDNDDEEDFSAQTFKGKFQCPRPNCSKLYKNRNGLKYHLQKGSCRIDVIGPDGVSIPTPLSSTPSSPHPRYKNVVLPTDGDDFNRIKPFYCKKCSKRYKNLNGLKYHQKVEHPDYTFDQIKGIS